ncbi:MAG: hypothetical protein DRJ55_06790 [Thermoprotei archaeon]|nr:MAG: hypothetical protein DRJ55_06790 [Thermoprotei archaeon]
MGGFQVAIVRVEHGDVFSAIRRALDLVGGLQVSDGDLLLIKPNMLNARSAFEGVTSDPRIVASLVKLARERGARVVVGDSSGSSTPLRTREVFKATGMEDAVKDAGGEVVDFDSQRPVPIEVASQPPLRVVVPSLIMEASMVINVPKLKTHVQTVYTGAIKNIAMGCIIGQTKLLVHRIGRSCKALSRLIVDIYASISKNVKLHVMDAIIGMEGNGPSAGDPVELNLILASDNALALDIAASILVGFKPEEIPSISYAMQRGLGPSSTDEVKLIGDNVPLPARKFKKPSTFKADLLAYLSSLAHPVLEWRPYIQRQQCTGCGSCADSCPASAIDLQALAIDYSKCIKCYVCHEVCPSKAIVLRRRISIPIPRLF